MSVKNIMSTRPVSVELDDKLALVKDIFEHSKFHHLLVLDDGELIGIISDRDLFKAISPYVGTITETHRDSATLNKRVHQIMSRKPIVLGEDASINEAITLFIEKNISCIPIVDANNRPIGIVSWRDILRHIPQDWDVN
ncbi:MAG: CBS domain-containing protein [Burkholderiales bacterium]|nr:CBS domain-containing protein [Burkholderiales bacterium]